MIVENIISAIVTGVLIVTIKVLLTVEHHQRRKAWTKE